MTDLWHSENEWAKSKKRNIDEGTIIDLLKMADYQSERILILDEIGIEDKGSIENILLDYVLDALKVPSKGEKIKLNGEHENFKKDCYFDRNWFQEKFYIDVSSEKILSHEEYINIVKHEVKENLKYHYI